MQGDCTVDITDLDGNHIVGMGLLVEGDHFGEISYFYRCPISSTIISRNYNSLARLQFSNLRMLLREYPKFKNLLSKRIFKYSDPNIRQLRKYIWSVPHFKGISKSILY